MTVLQYLANSLAWSGLGLMVGLTLDRIGPTVAELSGRLNRHDDDT